ncbi:hypothetical protein WSK_2317 [Novosphingobium sp. Rr 2-17]|uniref:hypothetical protein n=1 Tax=Novosphingobium sp. Rr 2-17 TaxID=555793 RepID=UPI0002699ED2|nr:hypothetical protein [Novosphingobium sp. Rr 2-17]EIZ79130.1 hypothetical protein WSK_2317 [Novosphingobium sp. Rr 2-17]
MHSSKGVLRLVIAGLTLLFVAGSPARAAEPVDFSGTWKAVSPRKTILPNDAAIPFSAKGREQYQQNVGSKAKKDLEFDLTTSRCSTPGLPRAMLTAQRFRIFQDPQVLTIGFEWNRDRRVIGLPGLPPQISLFGAADDASLVGTKMGTSRGQWEGNTLVVTSTEMSDKTLLDDVVPHTFGLKVTERLTLLDANTLEDRITIEDPEYFTKAWDTVLTYKRQPDAIFPEDVCLDRVFGAPNLPAK